MQAIKRASSVWVAVVGTCVLLLGVTARAYDYVDILYADEVLYQASGDRLVSWNGAYALEIVYEAEPEYNSTSLLWIISSSVVWRSIWDGNSTGIGNHANQWYTTQSEDCWAYMQSDGNFVLYDPSYALWATNTVAENGRIAMQTNGNLVVYTSSWVPIWTRF